MIVMNLSIFYTEIIEIQYCTKVMQTKLFEYHALFLQCISDISAIYHTNWQHVKMIIRRNMGAISAISRRDLVLAIIHHNDISQSKTRSCYGKNH